MNKVLNWFNQSRHNKKYRRGYEYAAAVMLEHGANSHYLVVSELEAVVGLSKNLKCYGPFDRGVEAAVRDFKEMIEVD